MRQRSRAATLSLLCLVCLWRYEERGFLTASTPRSSLSALKAAGDDFDFGDTPPSRAAPASTPSKSKTMASRDYDDDDDDEDDYDEMRRDEPVDSGSVATIVSFALLAVGVIAFLIFQVGQQNAAFSGSNDAPQIKKVQAVFDTYYAEGETVK
ncbi:unnamed protein product [Durusdinium trenchii]